jgi:hypothetical protein
MVALSVFSALSSAFAAISASAISILVHICHVINLVHTTLKFKNLKSKTLGKRGEVPSGIATNVVLLRIRGGRSLNNPEMGITRRLSKTCFNVEYPERVGTTVVVCTYVQQWASPHMVTWLVENIQFTQIFSL